MPRRPADHVRQPPRAEPPESRDRSHAEDRWLDLIADLIAEDLLNQEHQGAHTLRRVRQVQ